MYLSLDYPNLHHAVLANSKHHDVPQQLKHLNFQAHLVVLKEHLRMPNHNDRSNLPDLKFHPDFLTQLAA